MLREILRELDDNLTEDDLDNMIDEIDTDGSGTVDWEGEIYDQFFLDRKHFFFRIQGCNDWMKNRCRCSRIAFFSYFICFLSI